MLKYFFASLGRRTRGESLDLQAVYEDAQQPVLRLDSGPGPEEVRIDHNPLPGFMAQENAHAERWQELAEALDCLTYFAEREREYGAFSPLVEHQTRMVFIYRNPFDLFVAYARRYADMTGDLGEAGVMPVHPLMPVVHPPHESNRDPFRHFLDKYRETRFFECYLLHFLPYFHSQNSLADRLHLVTYESLMRDRRGRLRDVLDFIGAEVDPGATDDALSFTDIDRMKRHEAALGHSLSGDTYFFGAAKKNHITRTPARNWREVLSDDAVDYASQLFARYGVPVGSFDLEPTSS